MTNEMEKVLGYVSPIGLTIVCGASILFGFIFGWHTNERPGMGGVCFIIAIILSIGMRYPVKAWVDWREKLSNDPDELGKRFNKYVTTQAEVKISKKILEEKVKIDQEKYILNFMKSDVLTKKDEYTFTSDNFDEVSKGILNKIVCDAKKNKTKVTGQGLINCILKGIK